MKNSHIILLLFIILLIGCSEDSPTKEDNDEIDNDTIPANTFQEHIPWPSLADSPWPMYRHDPQFTGRSEYNGPELAEIKWSLPVPGVGSTVGFTSFAIGTDSTIYFGSSYETLEGVGQTYYLYAVASDGAVKWKFRDSTSAPLIYTSPLVTVNGSIVFGAQAGYSNIGYIYTLNPDGTLQWKFQTDSAIQNLSLNIGLNGNLYFADGAGNMYALSSHGELEWKLSADSDFKANESVGIPFSPSGNVLYVAGAQGYKTLYAIGIEGDIKWTFYSGDSNVRNLATPIVDNQGNIYLAPFGGIYANTDTSATGFFSINPQGEVRWKFGIKGLGFEPTIDSDGNLYFYTDKLYSVDNYGNLRWESDEFGIITAPLICDINRIVYVIGENLWAVSSTGESLMTLPIPIQILSCPSISGSGTMYLACTFGEKIVYAIH